MDVVPFTDQFWHQVCQRYRLPHEAKFVPLGSSQCQMYKIAVPNGREQVLRIYPPGVTTQEAIWAEMRLLAYLSQTTDLRIPIPIPGWNGEFITVICEDGGSESTQLAMFGFVDGETIEATQEGITEEMMFRIGQTLGQLDEALQKADTAIDPSPSKCKRPYGEGELIGGPLQALKKHKTDYAWLPENANADLLEKVADRLRYNYNRVKDSLPSQLLHTDAHFGNLAFDGTNIGVLDFGNFRRGPRIYELAPPLYSIDELDMSQGPNTCTSSVAKLKESLLAGYQDFVKLSDLELRTLPLFQAIHLFVVLGWCVTQKDAGDWMAQNGWGIVRRILHLLDAYEQDTRLSAKNRRRFRFRRFARIVQRTIERVVKKW